MNCKKVLAAVFGAAAAILMSLTSCDQVHEESAPVLKKVGNAGSDTTIVVHNVTINVYPGTPQGDSLVNTVVVTDDGKTIEFNATVTQSWSKTNYEVEDFSDEMSEIIFSGNTATATLVADNNVLTSHYTSEAQSKNGHIYELRLVNVKEGNPAIEDKTTYSGPDSTAVLTGGKRNYTFEVYLDGAPTEKTASVDMTSYCTRYVKGEVIVPDPDVTYYYVMPEFSSTLTTSTGSFVVKTMKNGQEVSSKTVKASGPNSLIGGPKWQAQEKSYNQSTGSVYVVSSSSEEVTSGEVRYTKTTTVLRTNTQLDNSGQVNTWTRVESNNFRYTGPDGVEYVATTAPGNGVADGGVVNANGDFTNVLTYTFDGKSQSVADYGHITIVKDPVITHSVETSFQSTSSESTGTFVVKTFSDGTLTDTKTVKATGPNSLVGGPAWEATQANYSQTTSSVSVKSRNSEEVTSGEVVYTKTTTVYTTTTTLANGETKTNSWTSVTSNNFKYKAADGNTYTAGVAAESANADGGSVSNGQFSNVLTKTFNGNSQNVADHGTITVPAAPEPDQPFNGDLTGQYKSSGVCAVVYGDSWRYGVAITTSTGTKVYAINLDGGLVEGGWFASDTYGYNCSYEYNGTLVPCLAKNGNGKLLWCDKEGRAYQSIKDTAWQARHGNNGKNSVYTDDYKVTVTKDGNHNIIRIESANGQVLKSLTDSSN